MAKKSILIFIVGLLIGLTIFYYQNEKTKISAPEKSVQDQADTFPFHGELSQTTIDRYYPNLLDTIQDKRIIGAQPIDLETDGNYFVSMLHNTGTFDQMILCTHDSNYVLVDHFYVGKATMFDTKSHTIEFQKVSNRDLEFHHVDWGYVNKKGEDEIDTLKYRNYILRITEFGKIEQVKE